MLLPALHHLTSAAHLLCTLQGQAVRANAHVGPHCTCEGLTLDGPVPTSFVSETLVARIRWTDIPAGMEVDRL